MKKIILDTNFLVYCAKEKIDYVSQINDLMKEGYELIVPKQVINELEKISEKAEKYSEREAAKLALKLISFNNIKIIIVRARYADDSILKLAQEEQAIVATMDLNLKNKLPSAIVIEGKKKLMLE